MSLIHVLVVTAVLQWSVVTGEGRTDQLTLSLCRVWEECLETAIDDNLEHAELGTPQAICGDFLDMLEKHGVDCGTPQDPEEETANVEGTLSLLEPHPSDEEQQQEILTRDEGGAERGDSKKHLPHNRPANNGDLWRTAYFDDCSGIYTAQAMFGSIASGVFPIQPSRPVSVYCDQTTDGGGWTVIQRRFDGSLEFFRKMGAYQDGFGDPRGPSGVSGEYWLGLDYIYSITSHNAYEVYIELEDWVGNVKYARYSTFSVGPGLNYTLSVGGYSGTAGDGFDLSSGAKFSTRWYDQDTDSKRSMAELYGGGWWYFDSHLHSNLNGPYFRDTDNHIGHNGVGVFWYPFNNDNYYSLKKTKMMVRPTDFSTRVANMKHQKQ